MKLSEEYYRNREQDCINGIGTIRTIGSKEIFIAKMAFSFGVNAASDWDRMVKRRGKV